MELLIVALIALIIGFLIGWLVEWRLDLAYWRMRAQQAGMPLAAPTEARAMPVPQAEPGEEEIYARTFKELLDEREAEVQKLRARLEEQEARYDALQEEFEAYMASHPDDLTAIKGIGRIYQWKLRDGGISTYAQLAQATPEQIRQIIDAPAWRKLDPESWIAQAKVLAQRGER